MPDLETILWSIVWAVVGFLAGSFVALARGRVKVLEYTVSHDRVGMSTQDAVFGNVQLSWQGTPVPNLYLTTLTLENSTVANYTNFKFKVFTGERTLLFNQRVEIADTTHVPAFSPEYAAAIAVPAGQEPTEQQHRLYWQNREYLLPVLNRGQRVILRYLTSVRQELGQDASPSVWIDAQHEGVGVRFRPNAPEHFGVPKKLALPLGLAIAIAAATAASWVPEIPKSVAATISLVTGLMVLPIGAGIVRTGRFLYRVVFH